MVRAVWHAISHDGGFAASVYWTAPTTKSQRPDDLLRLIVVDGDSAVTKVHLQGGPLISQVTHRLADRTFGQHAGDRLAVQPTAEAIPDRHGITLPQGEPASACHSKLFSGSHVLQQMGVPPELAERSIRVSLGMPTTADDVDFAVEVIVEEAERLRGKSGRLVRDSEKVQPTLATGG